MSPSEIDHLRDVLTDVLKNGKNHKFEWAKIMFPAIATIISVAGMLVWIGGWRTTIELEQKAIVKDVTLLDRHFLSHTTDAKACEKKIWDRFEVDRNDRQEMKDNISDISHSIDSIDTSQQRVEAAIEEITKKVK